jgi:hypothetical protein
MPIRLSATAPPYLNGCGGPWWDVSRRALEDILSTYYKYILSAVTHKLTVSWTHADMDFFFVLVFGIYSQICPHISVTLCIWKHTASLRLAFLLYKLLVAMATNCRTLTHCMKVNYVIGHDWRRIPWYQYSVSIMRIIIIQEALMNRAILETLWTVNYCIYLVLTHMNTV